MNSNQGKHTQRAEDAINAVQVARDLRRMLAEAKGPEDVARVKEQALGMVGIHPNNKELYLEIVADINRMNGTAPASAEVKNMVVAATAAVSAKIDSSLSCTAKAMGEIGERMINANNRQAEAVAKLGDKIERVEKQGAGIVAGTLRLIDGKRQAEEKPMDVAREVVEMLVDGLDLQQRILFFAMKNADGNQTHAARELKISQSKVNKDLPALRDAIRATGRELPEYLLPPAERKRLPGNPGRVAWGQDGIEVAETRTPFDEVAEKDERDGGAE